MMKRGYMKYKLRKDLKRIVNKTTLYQIQRISNGEFGGYIQDEYNLSQKGNAWVSGDAQVYGGAWVYGDARVSGNAQVYGNAWVATKSDLINVIVGTGFSITVTKYNVVIGCKLFTHEEVLKISKKQARVLGLEREHYSFYKTIIKQLIKQMKDNKK